MVHYIPFIHYPTRALKCKPLALVSQYDKENNNKGKVQKQNKKEKWHEERQEREKDNEEGQKKEE